MQNLIQAMYGQMGILWNHLQGTRILGRINIPLMCRLLRPLQLTGGAKNQMPLQTVLRLSRPYKVYNTNNTIDEKGLVVLSMSSLLSNAESGENIIQNLFSYLCSTNFPKGQHCRSQIYRPKVERQIIFNTFLDTD